MNFSVRHQRERSKRRDRVPYKMDDAVGGDDYVDGQDTVAEDEAVAGNHAVVGHEAVAGDQLGVGHHSLWLSPCSNKGLCQEGGKRSCP